MSPWIMVGVCFLSALLLFVYFRKEHRIYRAAGVVLALLGIYKTIDAVTDEALSYSWLIWVKRGVLLCMAVYAVIAYLQIRKESAQENTEDDGE